MGEALPHDSAELHVSGAATYTDDVREPAGCLHKLISSRALTRMR